ncbi:DUF981 family protein [Nocardiopsis quinghaiensis]|uniref:DUF981 family protein n=1 Tax=Nocardiopsis quinghaiensis TaxID=464995 RepID=UPI00123A4CA0|nr:DUF981 family protein [Nocardiopsis quinghaiensis]
MLSPSPRGRDPTDRADRTRAPEPGPGAPGAADRREPAARPRRIVPDGWALAFGALGLLSAVTGPHMSSTWPLAPGGFAFGNIVFGEPSLVFGMGLASFGVAAAGRVFQWSTPCGPFAGGASGERAPGLTSARDRSRPES